LTVIPFGGVCQGESEICDWSLWSYLEGWWYSLDSGQAGSSSSSFLLDELLSRELGTHKPVKARFRRWLQVQGFKAF